MLKEVRFGFILDKVSTLNQVGLQELALDLGVSEDTVRRDIDVLSRRGLLQKVRGGAISPAVNPLSFQDRQDCFTDGKRRIGLKVQELLLTAQTVFMDGGTTMVAVASCIPLTAPLRIITNNMALLPVLGHHESVELIVLGGQYNPVTKTNMGHQTCQQALNYQADLFLMGACSIDSQMGVTASMAAEGEIKKVMFDASRQVAVLSNQEKLGTVDFFNVTRLADIDWLITDLNRDDNRLDAYRLTGLNIL
ncbi:DeoR/GlpR family DNA-binding transcription regulator [Spirosoma linguale]|uniref:Transcriptional regulator, DeoR family n=1 Tax=Spirosoma linguale (strain ATCC 33905 / DSM 74 / LMG 10896 / Claus 1) TaxID=504472 RepID=D2QI12_SPILD|nr:transcriptional regulator, DeoR family [Spirosoma linguale DSM 74]